MDPPEYDFSKIKKFSSNIVIFQHEREKKKTRKKIFRLHMWENIRKS